MSSLYVIKGRDQGRRYTLEGERIRLGRDAGNALQLHDSEVSRSHAEILIEGDQWILQDLDSSNGTFVNGESVRRHVLQSGDRVQVGRTVMLFTRSELRPARDPQQLVSIIEPLRGESESRIISTLGREEGSRLFLAPQPSDSPWLARARSNLQVMYRTSLAVSHTLDIDELLKRILELIFEWVEADRGCIMLTEPDSDRLVPKAMRARRPSSKAGQLEISSTILEYVMQHEEGVLTSDARDDQRWDEAASILSMGIHEAICVPMQGRYGIVGVIYVDTHTPPHQAINYDSTSRHTHLSTKFSDEHLKLMVAIGHQAALAVEDTSYYSAMLQSERLAAVGQTVATLSHHIKNILQGIRGGSYLIEEGLKDQDYDVVTQGWKIVERNQERISNMVMDMLSFSKERKPEMQVEHLHDLLEDVLTLVRPKAKEKGVTIKYEPVPDLPEACFDPEAMHRALLNVVTNAVEACEQHEDPQRPPTVEVKAEIDSQAKQVMIKVCDNGEGIAAEDLELIFRAFESRKGSRGTGLGLPVSRKVLREHGGDIQVTSELGKGSCFTLTFPWMRGTAAEREYTEPKTLESQGESTSPQATSRWDDPAATQSLPLHNKPAPSPADRARANPSDSDAGNR